MWVLISRRYSYYYYMTSSVSGQDEPNPALWLVTRAGKMDLKCPLGISRLVPQDHQWSFFGCFILYNKSFIDQAFSVKMLASFFFCVFMDRDEVANIQPSWPHAWSIAHMYQLRITYALQILVISVLQRVADFKSEPLSPYDISLKIYLKLSSNIICDLLTRNWRRYCQIS